MHSDNFTIALAVAMLTVTVPAAVAQDVSPRNPVVNSEFELESPVGPVLADTAADECIGIGHQVLYGYESPQGTITGRQYDDPNVSNSSPTVAVANVTQNPVQEARFASGYGHCVWGDDTGYDLCWCNPAKLSADEAIHWSGHDDDTVGDVVDDGADGDREIEITKDSGGHNFWQAFPSPFQAYTGNFDALEVDIEAGQVPTSARVNVILSATPLQTQSPWLGYFFDCMLTFSSFDGTGQHSIDPVDATFTQRSSDCEDARSAWENASDEDDKRDVLGRLRVVQISFRGWQNVPAVSDEVVLDDIRLAGSTLAAEEAAQANVHPNPTNETEAPE